MKLILAAAITIVSLVACTRRTDRETGAAERHSADTVVTKREMRDTGIIRHDTNIVNDTIHKRGKRAAKTDTVKKP
jgi:hypothetical protein